MLAPLLAACLVSSLPSPQEPTPQPPNIVLVLVDDQGWTGTSLPMHDGIVSSSDFYRTPNLERLGREGMRFSNGYAAAPNCSPSRASIQTGKSPARLGMTDIIGVRPGSGRYRRFYADKPLLPPLPIPGLPEEETTLAELLSEVGYATAHFGKWHLAGGGPGRHGFKEHDGARGSEGRQPEDDPKDMFELTEKACRYIARQAAANRAFFVQVSHFAVHLPIRALSSTVERCDEREPGERHDHARHAAMTEDLDTALGILLDALDSAGIADDTFVIYTSDNGAYTHNGATNNLPLRKGKASVWEGGIRVPFVVRGPGVAAGSQCDVPVIGWDLLPTLCELAGVEKPLPEDIDGGSFAPLLRGEAGPVRRPRPALYWHFPHYQTQKGTTPQSALRLGDEKVIRFFEDGALHLFDLGEDVGERRDLAEEQPDRAAELNARLDGLLREVGARIPAPTGDRKRPPK